MRDLAFRLDMSSQLTTDGRQPYILAVERAFGGAVDYAQIIKQYGPDPAEAQRRYSPAVCTSVERHAVTGSPDPAHVSTSYIERQNLPIRMHLRRYARLTNAFSRKIENHAAAVALHFMHYNFARPHQTLSKPYPTTPAMAAGVADHVWTVREIAGLLD
jgi:hypothetical protein